MTRDQWGNPLSYANADAVRALGRAITKLNAYQADPLAETDAILAEHPGFVMAHAFRAGMLATTLDRVFLPEMQASLRHAEALAAQANDRERGHIAALRAWEQGDFAGATEEWGRVAMAHPRDILAIQLAHIGDFALGYSQMLRDRVARVLPAWSGDLPGRGFLLGMLAFGLEEAGEYARAEEAGRAAQELQPQDAWAVHAVAHVMEMQGRSADGAGWLEATRHGWAPDNMFAYHNWWHWGLYHLDAGETAPALRLFDEEISGGGFGQAMELADGAALLWRLHVLGHDVGARWNRLAEGWRARMADRYYAFNDLHAMMTLIGLGDEAGQRALLAEVEAACEGQGTNAMMAREVGLPACRGFAAFGRGDYAAAIAELLPVRGKANRFGGSHAQRDVFSWTLTEAAIRAGEPALASALAAERLAAKPASPLHRAWAERAAVLA